MLMNVSKKIELIANLAIIVVACLLGMVLIKSYLLGRPAEQLTKSQIDSQPVQGVSQLGNNLNVSSIDIDWKHNKQTLILAISSSCHFCTESAAFYKTLAQKKGSTRLIAVLPQSVEEGKSYLQTLGVSVDETRQLSLANIGVHGTPTLLLVDASGVLKSSWVGKLMPNQEAEVLASLQ